MTLILCLIIGLALVAVTVNYSGAIASGGVSISWTQNRTADGSIAADPTIPVALAGTLSTRTDDDTGVFTGSGSGLLSENDVVDVYWTGGRRYGMAIGTPSGSTYPLEGGAGDVLPAQATAITVAEQTVVNVTIDGDNLEILGLQLFKSDAASTARGHITFKDAAADAIAQIDLDANEAQVYDIDAGFTNPFTGDVIATAHATQSDSSATATLKIVGVQDTTP